jgi:hypothetical protein
VHQDCQWTGRRFYIFYGSGNADRNLKTSCIVNERVIWTVKRVELVSYRMSYIILRVRWCIIIVLNVFVPTGDDTKDSFYEALEREFYQFRNYRINILLRGFNVKVDREGNLRQKIGNEISHEINNNNRDKVLNFATRKHLIFKEYNVLTLQHLEAHFYISWWKDIHPNSSCLDRKDGIQVSLMAEILEELTLILIIIWWLKNL